MTTTVHSPQLPEQRLALIERARLSVLEARDSETGEPFSRDGLIDQLGVFFLAGHETTASSLTKGQNSST